MRNGGNIPSIFAQTVKHHPNKPALIYEATGETWTFTQLDELSNAVAHWARDQGLVSGDVVAVFMESRPLQVALWLGLAKVGVEAALINFNLRHDSLMHCIRVSGSRAIVFGAELADGKKILNTWKLVRKIALFYLLSFFFFYRIWYLNCLNFLLLSYWLKSQMSRLINIYHESIPRYVTPKYW